MEKLLALKTLVIKSLPLTNEDIEKKALEKYPVEMCGMTWGWADINEERREGYEECLKELRDTIVSGNVL